MAQSDPEKTLSRIQSIIQQCMVKHQFGLKKGLQKAKQRQKQGKPFDRDLAGLIETIESSRAEVQQRQQNLPNIVYPESLPVSERKKEIIEAIKEHQVVIIAGETGSGKTTQIPKMCLQAGLGVKGLIGHTQPRRLAARSVSQRIADELNGPLGGCVGYKIRFQDKVSDDSYIKLMTDGILLAEVSHDRFLSQYDTIIIDEAHERSLNIDFLLGYLKQLLSKRPDLKVIITSATIDHWRFAKFFNDAPVLEVSGRTYPVEMVYQPIGETDSEDEDSPSDEEGSLESGILQAVQNILRMERQNPNPNRPGDILVFLSGEREIRQVADRLRKQGPKQFEILPLYSRLSNNEQNRIFQPHSNRRIVLSTNVAETSITVPNIGYVIDSGLARISRYSFRTKVQRLPIEAISQASANQRAGRCGRVAEGVCIRLYSEDEYLNRPEYTEPEIQRTNLASVILQMQGLKLGELGSFPFIDPPDTRLINDGYRLLDELSAVDQNRQISNLGRQLLKFPVDPRISRMLLAAKELHCLSELLIIASGMSVQEPWQRPHDKQGAADESLKRFQHEQSDFLTYCIVWNEVEQQKAELSNNRFRRWLLERFLSYLRVREWQDVYRQLKQACHELGWKENSEPASYEAVHQAILSGLLSHVAIKDDAKGYQGARNRNLVLFPGSALIKRKPKWVMCAEIVETEKVYGRTAASIEPEWVEQMGLHALKKSHFEPHWEKKRACAVAYEQTSLFGLVITPRRKVNFSHIDEALSRELFIRHALVLQEYETRAPYFRHNKKLIENLEYEERKSRRRDILVDDETLFGLFNAIIPEQVVNGKSFESWRKKAEKESPNLLFLKKEDLLQKPEDSVSNWDFPDQVELEGGKLKIDYQFEPGKSQDGLNIVVPVTLINQVEEDKLEWLVPGLEKEKCVAMIKSLPKNLRKHFVPAPDFADAFLATNPDRDRSLKSQFAQFLRSRKNVDITNESWDDSALPLHLLANLKVLNDKGKPLSEGRDIRQIKLSLQGEFQASLKQLADTEHSDKEYDHWAFDSIPEVMEVKQTGATVKAFPALVDKGKGVSLQLFDTEFAAQQSMEKGLLKLCLLALPQQVRYLKKQHSLPEKIAIKYAPFGDQQSLTRGLVEKAFYHAFVADLPIVRSEQEFNQRLQSGKGKLVNAAQAIQTLLESILALHHDIVSQLANDKSPAKLKTKADIKQQLKQLFPQNWITLIPYSALKNYPRYLKGILQRWQRLQGKIERDQQASQEMADLWQQYTERKQKHDREGVLDKALDEWRWALEEYRISIFAQGMKTTYPVSYKRLQQMWHNVAS